MRTGRGPDRATPVSSRPERTKRLATLSVSVEDQPPVTVEPGDVSVADRVAELWVALAADQRAHGSHLQAATNRDLARDAVAQHAVTGGLVVARADDEIVGFVTFSKEQGDYDVDSRRGLIHDIFVRESYRGRGVGGRLLDAAEERLASDGIEYVSLEVLADNAAARRFYERAGYDEFRVEMEKQLE